jgi:TetR/AcrR family transcriptional repressor of nem operon
MRYSADRKKETRAAIIQAASKVFKEIGFQSGSIDKVMDKAGLTAGGFYAHFPSKDQLFAETLSKAFTDAEAMLESGLDDSDDAAWMNNFLRRYMSRAHRKEILRGCAIPPLVSEVSRANQPAKQALENYFRSWRSKIKSKLASKQENSQRDATALIAMCLGAMSLARAVSDETLADEILEDCFQFSREALGDIPDSSSNAR